MNSRLEKLNYKRSIKTLLWHCILIFHTFYFKTFTTNHFLGRALVAVNLQNSSLSLNRRKSTHMSNNLQTLLHIAYNGNATCNVYIRDFALKDRMSLSSYKAIHSYGCWPISGYDVTLHLPRCYINERLCVVVWQVIR